MGAGTGSGRKAAKTNNKVGENIVIRKMLDLNDFVSEQPDNNIAWKDSFSKSDIVFLGDISYEQFKSALAKHLFETQHSQQSLDELVEVGCEEELGENSDLVSDALIDFLHIQDRPKFDVNNPDTFMCEFKRHFGERYNVQGLNIDNVCEVVKEILIITTKRLRESFVNFNPDNLPDKDTDSYEFAHMTGLLGEILATLVFQQIKGCGDLVRTKTFLDNPNMPRHGEDFIGYVFNPKNEKEDILHLVEAKSTKGAISPQINQIKERFSHYLNKGIPYDEVNRLKIEIKQKLGDESDIFRKRITRLLWKVNKNPNQNQIIANAFLHYPSNYNPHKSTFKELGGIQTTKEDGSIIKMDAARIYIITFRFDDFEQTVREVFERAWTI